jgi:hypothetical protein
MLDAVLGGQSVVDDACLLSHPFAGLAGLAAGMGVMIALTVRTCSKVSLEAASYGYA